MRRLKWTKQSSPEFSEFRWTDNSINQKRLPLATGMLDLLWQKATVYVRFNTPLTFFSWTQSSLPLGLTTSAPFHGFQSANGFVS